MHFTGHKTCEFLSQVMLPFIVAVVIAAPAPGSGVNNVPDATEHSKEAKERTRLELAAEVLKAGDFKAAAEIVTPVLDSDNAELRQKASKLVVSALSNQKSEATPTEGADHLLGHALEEMENQEKAAEAYANGMRSNSPKLREQSRKDLEQLVESEGRWYRWNPFKPISGSISSLGNLIWLALLFLVSIIALLACIRRQAKQTSFVIVGGSNLQDLTWFTDLLGHYRTKFWLTSKYLGSEPQATFLSVPSSTAQTPGIFVTQSDLASPKVGVLSGVITVLTSATQIKSRRFWTSVALWWVRPKHTLRISKQQHGHSGLLTAELASNRDIATEGRNQSTNEATDNAKERKLFWVASTPDDDFFESAKDLAFWVITQLQEG